MALPAMASVRAAFPTQPSPSRRPCGVAQMFEENTSAAQDALVVIGSSRAEATQLEAELRRDCAVAQFVSDGVERAASGNPAAVGLLGQFSRRTADAACGKAARPAAPVGLLPRARSRPRSTRARNIRSPSLAKGRAPAPASCSRRICLKRPESSAWRLAPARPRQALASGAHGGARRPARPRTRRDLRARGVAGDRDAGRAIESAMPSDVRIVNPIGRTDLRP